MTMRAICGAEPALLAPPVLGHGCDRDRLDAGELYALVNTFVPLMGAHAHGVGSPHAC